MKITSILSKEAITESLQAQDQNGVLRELSRLICKVEPSLKETEVYQVLKEREKLGSTGIGNGIAIPHGKLSSAKKIVACFGKSVQGIDFQSQDGEPVFLFFALITPENAAGLHLKALAKLSRLLKERSFRESLKDSKSASEIFEIFLKEDDK